MKAKLVREPKDWPWNSARFRDEFARLALPSRRAAFQAAAGGEQKET